MGIRKITVQLSGTIADADALRTAFAVAKRFGSHVDALFVRPDLQEVRALAGEALWITEGFEQAAATEAERLKRMARRRFKAAQKTSGVGLTDRIAGSDTPSARWREIVGSSELIALEGRLSDLLVLGHMREKASARLRVARDAAMLTAGRPVMLTPPALLAGIGETIAIAWNGSSQAAHAVAGALPFLKNAAAVHIITAKKRGYITVPGDVDAGERLAEYLALHGIEAKITALESVSGPVGEAVLKSCNELGADLLVMGCYGHSRMRELIMGGVTRHIVANANLPLLTAH